MAKFLAAVLAGFVGSCLGRHQHILILSGDHWENVGKVETKIQKKSPGGYSSHPDGWFDTNYQKGHRFGYVLSGEIGDTVSLRITKGETVLEPLERVIEDCTTDSCPVQWEWKADSPDASPEAIWFPAAIRHLDMWKQLFKNIKNANTTSAKTLVEKLPELWRDVRKNYAGYEINLFMDGFPPSYKGRSLVLEFYGKEAKPRKTTRNIQVSGAVFSCWSFPKEEGKLVMKFEGEHEKLQELDISTIKSMDSTFDIDGKTVHTYVMVNALHARMTDIWTKVHGHHDSESHPFWHRMEQEWNGKALHALFDSARKQPFEAGEFESEEASAQGAKSWKILVIAVLLISLIGVIAYWWFCRESEDEISSDDDVETQQEATLAQAGEYAAEVNEAATKVPSQEMAKKVSSGAHKVSEHN